MLDDLIEFFSRSALVPSLDLRVPISKNCYNNNLHHYTIMATMIFRDYFNFLTHIFFFLSADRFSPYDKGHIHQGDASGHQILHDVRRIDHSSRLLGDDRVDSAEQTHLHNQARGECIYKLPI